MKQVTVKLFPAEVEAVIKRLRKENVGKIGFANTAEEKLFGALMDYRQKEADR